MKRKMVLRTILSFEGVDVGPFLPCLGETSQDAEGGQADLRR
jgi:hypothetical protein